MSKFILFIMFSCLLFNILIGQQVSYGHKTLSSTEVFSDLFFIKEGYILDSLIGHSSSRANILCKFGYYPDGKLKWDYNYRFYQESRNGRAVTFPAYRMYSYNAEGKVASSNYFYWNGIVWINKRGNKYDYTYDDNGNILTKEYKYTDTETTWGLDENTYDSNGNLIRNKVTRSGTSYPTINIWEYDSLNRLILRKSYVDTHDPYWTQYIYEYPENGKINCKEQNVNMSSEYPVYTAAIILMEFDEDDQLICQQIPWDFYKSDSIWKEITYIDLSYDDKGKVIDMGDCNRAHYNSEGNLDSLIFYYVGSASGFSTIRAKLVDSYGNTIIPRDLPGHTCFYYSTLTPEIEKNLTLTSINNSDDVVAGDIVEITWESDNVEKVTIAFSPDNGTTWSLVAENLNAIDGSYSWLVPVTESNECLIRVSDPNTMNLFDECDSVFSVTKELLLTYPNGNELWEVNSPQTIFWKTNNVTESIGIYLSIDNSVTWTKIAENIPAATGSYDLIVPGTTSVQGRIKVIDAENNSIFDISNNSFTIYRKEVSLLTPNGGETLTASESYDITWQSEYIDNIKIELSYDSSDNWLVLCDSIPAIDQKFTLQLPELTSVNCKIKISDLENTNTFDESDSPFEIMQSLGIEDELSGSLPTEYQLYQNYPNPFNPSTCIRYDIPEVSFVSLKIYNLSGEEIAVLVNGYKSPGKYQTMFDANKLTSGIYFYTITTNSFTKTCKMIFMK